MNETPHLIDHTPYGETVWACGDRVIYSDPSTPGRFYVWTATPRTFVGEATTLEQATEVANHDG